MDQLDFSAFIERADEFEKVVRREKEVTTFCSGTVWQTAAFRSLHGGGDDSNFLIFEEQGTWLIARAHRAGRGRWNYAPGAGGHRRARPHPRVLRLAEVRPRPRSILPLGDR